MKDIGLENMLNKKNGLKYKVSEGGLNLSVGERQLICIARAIMRKSKIIIMDEATSSIDYKTETLIQKSLEKSLKNSTVITIAHRIKTIINYDRIIVLQSGELIEQGSPRQLINSKKGTFYELYMQSNL
jgi:ABC-type multidrug transport system fused ATPase/permease subunit